MKRYFSDKTGMRILRLLVILFTALMMLLSLWVLHPAPALLRITLIFLFVFGILTAGICLPLYYRNAVYFVSGAKIVKQSGIFFLKKQTLRTEAIQYTTAISCPFSKQSGFNFLVLNALGGRVILPFLSRSDMDAILRIIRSHTTDEVAE